MSDRAPSRATEQVPPTVLRGRVVTPSALVPDGVVVVEGDRLAFVGTVADAAGSRWAQAVAGAAAPAGGTTLLPGLVDLHDHGGGGASFPDAATADEARVAVREHLRHGTTTLLASLVTADRATLLSRVATLAGLAEAGEIAGLHLEGPFLSPARCGAQNPADMLDGDADLVAEVARAARGTLRTMTVAPEVPGVVDGVIAALAAAGAVPSIGHTDASTEQTEVAIGSARTALAASGAAVRGVRPTATHLFNGMRPLHHREPGPVAACLAAAARGELVLELVADGTHLAHATVRSVMATVGAENVALVTDAMAAAGMADGEYALGPVRVRVEGGVARLADGGSIAGGTYHLLDVVRETVAAGVPLVEAVRSASLVPAGVLGLEDVGALEAGRRADVVVTDADLRPLGVLRAGAPVQGVGGAGS
ncbi:N-acetylglucosamine-6-phosphate deacetylase [Cellulomonas sp. PhB143]|uniref:N-acetylglucosamine-6-phosphate deacetylase n=1 Tax=Cellulomonas sp. PhB143 TaxID=2485186 RepID=UPI000F47792F|nr:amidohydrolase family protein [Cellulomonas sp. PhB143]